MPKTQFNKILLLASGAMLFLACSGGLPQDERGAGGAPPATDEQPKGGSKASDGGSSVGDASELGDADGGLSEAGAGGTSQAGVGGAPDELGGAATEAGSGGAAGAALVDLCQGGDCSTPPINDCISSSIFESYDNIGSCEAGKCIYRSRQMECACKNHQCTTDPCLAVECKTPPPKTCTGDALTTYAASGTCSGGSCSYQSTKTPCTGVCQTCSNQACVPVISARDDSCDGTCDENGACRKVAGQSCSTTAACLAGLTCVDGVCCNSACTGSCMACDLPSQVGTCTAVASGAPHGARQCATGQSCLAGACKGVDGSPCSQSTDCGNGACTQFFLDRDGDTFGDQAQKKGLCMSSSAAAPAGYSANGEDCCDDGGNLALAKSINPAAVFQASPANICGITWDYNCSGKVEKDQSSSCDWGACQLVSPEGELLCGKPVYPDYCYTSPLPSPEGTYPCMSYQPVPPVPINIACR